MKETSKTFDLAGKTLTLEVGKLAQLATASVLARLGDTVVLATVVASKKETTLDYFPLSVEYIERLYAGGRIKGSRWVKRQGRPTDESVLTGRLIDRSIRPLFPKEFKNDVQVVVTVLSVDGENEPDILSMIAVSAALALSPIPWNGPVSAMRIGYDGTNLLVNPGGEVLDKSQLDLIATQTKEKTIMLEAGALQVSEKVMADAIEAAQKQNKAIIEFIEKFAKEVGSPKITVSPDTKIADYIAKIEKTYKAEVEHLVALRAHNEGSSADQDQLVEKIYTDEQTAGATDADKKAIAKAVEKVFFKIIRSNILKKGQRPDGRKTDEIRKISAQVDILPRTHGSALFQRGDTQALSIATLGAPRMEQLIESAEGEESKRYIHHYAFPPYSVGETGKTGFLSRREIGHGALGERALLGVIPPKEVFPYTILVNSEVLSSNGSTSMASTCGSTLALMAAGVPILKPVAGIAMGMVSEPAGSDKDKEYVILTDILGLEDFSGDMDFKVAGTDTGITAIQLDVKTLGLTLSQIKEIFEKAKAARLFILEKMLAVIATPRPSISKYAPKIEMIKIPVEKIGELIGPGGKVIKAIMAATTTVIDVEDDGSVSVTGEEEELVKRAIDWIKGLTREVTVGEQFEGEVKRILPFGAFVEILPGKEGMVHVSHMSDQFVKNPSDVVTIGEKVKVKVIEIDEQGRINLTMRMDESGGNKTPGGQAGPVGGRERVDRGPRTFQRGPRVERPQVARSEHPLAQQFRRERSAQQGPRPRFGGPRRSGPPAAGPRDNTQSRFRKTHY
ncbi:MAG TPA: polyribonucleotide nucleotidyltransferase [Candidatus Saccharimonadales bacterium]|nr:polyribonucleotide nucleotidyltransferase [Candidatus Saccharimonadales bacterium]